MNKKKKKNPHIKRENMQRNFLIKHYFSHRTIKAFENEKILKFATAVKIRFLSQTLEPQE